MRASEVAQGKGTAIGDLSLTPGTHTAEREA